MRLLNGLDLAGFIEERQAHQVRALRQGHGVNPKLAIIVTGDNPVVDLYVRVKQRYGADILVAVDVHRVPQAEAAGLIKTLNEDAGVHGIIVQLPLADPRETDGLINLVAPAKDVDGLAKQAPYDPATPLAILWLLAGYNVELKGRDVLVIGRGKLVGAPLERLLAASGIRVRVADRQTVDLAAETLAADVIISAAGSGGLLKPDMIKHGAVVIDAGVASEGGKTVGDVDPAVYERDDLTITPAKGGVGPLTVCALFENVIRAAARLTTDQNTA
jgi:methylenetetrahydrofolate dehydrogenase (NADP+)/methenyltetrahydrofolate cyclohydrolase